MSISIKSADEIQKMRVAGRLAAEVLEMIGPFVVEGVTTEELDRRCYEHIVQVQKAIPACLGYPNSHARESKDALPFPKSVCTSINHVVCHGIPGARKLVNGDIINIDVTVIYDGFHGDTSKMFLVGPSTRQTILKERLCRIAQESLYKGISVVRPGAKLGDIGAIIEKHAHAANFSVVEDYCGHGIGRGFHEAPSVLHYRPKDGDMSSNTNIVLVPGMTFTIEPMINAGKKEVKLLPDWWTVTTRDRQPSAQWEHTILVTENGHEVLTLRNDEDPANFA